MFKDSANIISVYFRFDTIINGFEVSGILYPSYSEEYGWSYAENGVRLFFASLNTNKEYVWTDWEEDYKCFNNTFMSKNVQDIILSEDFLIFISFSSYLRSFSLRSIQTFLKISPV